MALEKYRDDDLDRSCEKRSRHRFKEERNILREVKRRETNWIGHTCLHGKIEGRIEATVRRRRRRNQLLDDINPLNTERRLLYLKTQFVPRSKHFSSRL